MDITNVIGTVLLVSTIWHYNIAQLTIGLWIFSTARLSRQR